MDHVVVVHEAEGGYWAEVPSLEGCFAQGDSIEEALEDCRGAITSHLEALREDGIAPPRPASVVVGTVTVPEPSAA